MTSNPRSHQVGEATVVRVQELVLRNFKTTDLIPDWKPGIVDRFDPGMVPDCLDETRTHVVINTHSWVVRTPQHTIVIDAGVGNDKSRPIPDFDHLHEPFLERLSAVGVTPESVDYVLLTHLHSDHVGWNTRLVDGAWQPTFPNARTILPQLEFERLRGMVEKEGADSQKVALYFDSVLPILEAGRVTMIGPEGGLAIEGFEFFPTPGHCSGHMSIEFTSGKERGFFSGDVFHHPVQVYWPDWSSVFSEDHEKGRASRLWALGHMADTKALVFTPHFASSSAGRVFRADNGFTWSFA